MKPNEYNELLITTTFLTKLKRKGFLKIEEAALKKLVGIFNCYLIKYLKSLNKHIQHSERGKLCFMNFITNNYIYNMNYGINLSNLQIYETHFLNYKEVDLNKLINPIETSHENSIKKKYESLMLQIIHKEAYLTCNNKAIKDVIEFPPAHTFKRTKFLIDDEERNYRLMELGKQRLAVKGSLVRVDNDMDLDCINFMFQ